MLYIGKIEVSSVTKRILGHHEHHSNFNLLIRYTQRSQKEIDQEPDYEGSENTESEKEKREKGKK
jgi:hypothetical protein